MLKTKLLKNVKRKVAIPKEDPNSRDIVKDGIISHLNLPENGEITLTREQLETLCRAIFKLVEQTYVKKVDIKSIVTQVLQEIALSEIK